MNDRKLARFMGKQAVRVAMGTPQLTFDVTRIFKAPPYGGVPAPAGAFAEVQGFMGGRVLDPPVGGFAPGDVLMHIPSDQAFTTTIAAIGLAALPQRRFSAGIYDISGSCRFSAAVYALGVLFSDPSLPTLGAPYAGIDHPQIVLANPTTASGEVSWSFTAFFDKPWNAFLQVIGTATVVDAALSGFTIQVLPVHLLDDNASAR